MIRSTILFSSVLALAGVVGCYTGPNTDLSPPAPMPSSAVDGTDPSGAETGANADGGPAVAAAEGVPCEVAKVFTTSCTSCHGAKPTHGAPSSLVTYEDLTAKSDSDPGRSAAELSLERMKSSKRPMPPDGLLAADEIAIVETWIGAGMPKGSCGTKAASADGGTVTPPPGDGGATPKDGGTAPSPTVCTSGTTWAPGTPSSAMMQPGKKCIACHSANSGPSFTIAGTVYPTLHEPDSCNGVNGGMSVVIVDAAGKSHTMPVNAAGNFTRVTGIPMPYKAMIVNGTKTREMKTAQTDGDCNGCHTEQGNHSPGRIMAP
jgi:mono/diheme cytochrome c family protein